MTDYDQIDLQGQAEGPKEELAECCNRFGGFGFKIIVGQMTLIQKKKVWSFRIWYGPMTE